MALLILGEVCSFFGALCLAISTFGKTKKDIVKWQVADQVFNAAANLFLLSFSGAVVNSVNVARNYLTYKGKFNRRMMAGFLVAIIVLGLIFNNRGFIGLIPIIAAGEYTIALAVFKNPQDTRIMPAFNLAMWAVYDFVIMAYPMFVMDIVIAALSVINFVQYRHKRRRKKHKH